MTVTNEQEQVVCDFLRKLCPGRDWMYLGEVEHLWIAEMVGAITATVGAGTCNAVLDEGYYKGINGVCEGLYCSKCKEPLSRRFKHCPNCGRKVIGIKEEA